MCRSTALLSAKDKLKPIFHISRSNGALGAITPRKLGNDTDSNEGGPMTNDKNNPVVAFSKPPPLPPFLGPLVALSLLETWSRRDGDDS